MRNLIGPVVVMLCALWTAAFGGLQSDRISISGVTVDGNTGQPIPGVVMRFGSASTPTDRDGRFTIDGLAPGAHILFADRDGYMQPRLDGSQPAAPSGGIELTLHAGAGGAVGELVLRMFPTGVVTGTLYDEAGQPVRSARVVPCRYTYNLAGDWAPRCPTEAFDTALALALTEMSPVSVRQLPEDGSRLRTGTTNDLGQFRMFNLYPGDYVFHVVPREPLQPFYYPRAANIVEAEAVRVESGVETRLGNLTTAAARGGAVLRIGVRDETGARTIGHAVEVRQESGERVFRGLARGGATVSAALAPGAYIVEVYGGLRSAFRASANPLPILVSSRASVRMTGADADIEIPMTMGARLNGSAIAEAGDAGTPLAGVSVVLTSDEIFPALQVPFTSNADGAFVASSIPHGPFRVDVAPPAAGWCIGSVRSGSRDVRRDGLQVQGEAVDLQIVLLPVETSASRLPRLRGAVADASGRPVPGAVVAAVPVDDERMAVAATADQRGAFEFPCIAAGDYRIYAWDEIDGAAYRNRDFLERHRERAHPIRLEAGNGAGQDAGNDAPLTLVVE